MRRIKMSHIEIYSKEYGENPYDFLKIWILFPSIRFDREYSEDESGDLVRVTKLDFSTGFKFSESGNWRSVGVSLLGFGFSFSRQTGY
jgi:hypothetical protein